MATNTKSRAPAGALFSRPIPNILELTLGINTIASNQERINPYSLRNEVLFEQEKQRVRLENGFDADPPGMPLPALFDVPDDELEAAESEESTEKTKPTRIRYGRDGKTLTDPNAYSFDELEADALHKPDGHSKKLGRNIVKLENKKRPKFVDAHHIVSSTAEGALPSRLKLFAWKIGINDADNGVFLPRFENVKVRGLYRATWHAVIHTPTYHGRVFARLLQADPLDPESARLKLRGMKAEMQRGKFRYT